MDPGPSGPAPDGGPGSHGPPANRGTARERRALLQGVLLQPPRRRHPERDRPPFPGREPDVSRSERLFRRTTRRRPITIFVSGRRTIAFRPPTFPRAGCAISHASFDARTAPFVRSDFRPNPSHWAPSPACCCRRRTSPIRSNSKTSSARPRKWRSSAAWPPASHTNSTTC